MNAKAILQKLFPTKADYLEYLRWRRLKHEYAEVEKLRLAQQAEREKLMAVSTGDPDDDDFEPLADGVWEQVKGA